MVLVEEECCDTPAEVVELVLAVRVVVGVVAAAAVVGQSCFHCCCGDVEAPALDPGNAMGTEGIDVVAAVAAAVAEILRLARETGVEVEVEGVRSPDEQRKDP